MNRVGRLTRPDRAQATLLGLIAAWVVCLTVLVVLRHERFRTVDYDLAIHDQSIWLWSRFRDFCTVRGLPILGHHATFGYALLVPLAWLGAGPNTWNVLQVVVLGLTALPIAALARRRGLAPWTATLLGAVWLAQPSLASFAWETFHPEVIAMLPLLGAYVAGEARRFRLMGVCLLAAVIWKEDVALAIIGLGMLYLLRRRRRLGCVVAGAGLVWFVMTAGVLVPSAAGGSTVYGSLYGDLGSTPGAVALTGLQHPTRVIDRLRDNQAGRYVRDLLAPAAFLPVLSPGALLIGAPQAAVNLLSLAGFTRSLEYHYQAMPLLATGIATVEGLARLARRRRDVAIFARGAVTAAAIASTVAWSVLPIGNRYDAGYWPLDRPTELDSRRSALALVAPLDVVSADFFFVPHLAHRPVVFTFPNPWFNKNYGTDPTQVGDDAAVRWLLVDLYLMGAEERSLFEMLLSDGEFEVVLDDGRIVAARRARPPVQ